MRRLHERTQWVLRVGAAISVGGLAVSAAAQAVGGTPGQPSADAILRRLVEKNGERLAALEHYTTDRTYEVVYRGTGGYHRAQIKVKAEYVGPDQKRFTVESEEGSKFLCEKVLSKLVEGEQEAGQRANRMQTTLSPENYNADIVGEEAVVTLGGGAPMRAWVLKVTPRVANKFTYRGTVWVSEDDYAVIRIAGEPAKNPSWWIDRAKFDSRYVRRGQMWLPGRNVSSSHVRIGGEATLTIDYGTYPEIVTRVAKPAGKTDVKTAANRIGLPVAEVGMRVQ